MEPKFNVPEQTFSSPQEELQFLREQVAKKEQALTAQQIEASPEHSAKETIAEYRQLPPEQVISSAFQSTEAELSQFNVELSPEPHDAQIAQLAALVAEKGVKNVLALLEKMHNPHLTDDFDRFLAQYVKSGLETGIQAGNPLFRALQMTLYEITLPERDPNAPEKPLRELLSSMEQFYAGMMAVRDKQIVGPNYFTLELAVAHKSEDFIFYAAVPDSKRQLFENHIRSVFHDAKMVERKDDYNIFNPVGASVGSYAHLSKPHALPLRMYDLFDHDPLEAVLNSFTKIDRDSDGAAIQTVFRPGDGSRVAHYKGIIGDIQKGKTLKEALGRPETLKQEAWSMAKEFAGDIFTANKKSEEEKKDNALTVDDIALTEIKRKVKHR